jgi:multiple antibiotic resistance protein
MDIDITHLWTLFLGTIVGLLPITNPLGCATTFLAITEGDDEAFKRTQARRAALYSAIILAAFLLFGSFIIKFFGISLSGIRIAGGILVVKIGMGMLHGTTRRDPAVHEAAVAKRDISFAPLAMPMLSGPGAIGVTLGFASLVRHWLDYAAILGGICVVALLSWWTLLLSSRIGRLAGPVGVNAMTQVMGLLLACMGVQFCVNGVTAILRDPVFVQALRATWHG